MSLIVSMQVRGIFLWSAIYPTFHCIHLPSEGHHSSIEEVLPYEVMEIEALLDEAVIHLHWRTLTVEGAVLVAHLVVFRLEGVKQESHLHLRRRESEEKAGKVNVVALNQ